MMKFTVVPEVYREGHGYCYPSPTEDALRDGCLVAYLVTETLWLHDGWDWNLAVSYCRLDWIEVDSNAVFPRLQLKLQELPQLKKPEVCREIEIKVTPTVSQLGLTPRDLAGWFLKQIPLVVKEELEKQYHFWTSQTSVIKPQIAKDH